MRKSLFAVMLLALGGCNFWYNEVPSPDDLMHVIPWFDHMILSKAVHPYQRNDIPRNTPAGIVPVGGGEADWHRGNPLNPSGPQFGFDTAFARRVMHTSAVAAPAARSGQELFQTYCAVCHGSGGAANGTVTKYIAAPSLLTERTRGLSDGLIYSILRYGGGYLGSGLMPRYGDKIFRIDERWRVVDYVRELQRNSPVPPAGVK